MNQLRRLGRTMILVLLAIMAGCASNEKANDLHATMRAYEGTLRWGDLRTAVGFVHPEERPDNRTMMFELKRFENLRVTGVTPMHQAPPTDEDTFIQVVEIRVANRHTAIERAIQDRQVWRYDAEDERWWLMSGLPDFSRQR
ncbi:MAG: hypothetical protein R3200_14040 [Xanthomonadales bacterium]|nr:hypothetical protein [Xanthomonadales bacterium]